MPNVTVKQSKSASYNKVDSSKIIKEYDSAPLKNDNEPSDCVTLEEFKKALSEAIKKHYAKL